jgi:hypothetical protein
MLFMVMHKTNAQMEAGEKPNQSIIENMGKLIGEAIEKGILHNGAGLKGSAERVRVSVRNGEATLTKGPYKGDNELIAGFGQFRVKSMEDGIYWAKRFADVVGDVDMEDGPFAESKELIAGFTILRLGSLAEAKAWTERYAAILGDIEVDVRLVSE